MFARPVADAHWDELYCSRPAEQLGWYQARPDTVDEVQRLIGEGRARSVIDVGGGASTFVDHMLRAGVEDLAVIDLSASALGIAEERLGDRASSVRFEVADVLSWEPDRAWDVWHDRAVFHFLVTPEQQRAYVDVASRAVARGGHIVIAAFALDGPDHCAGLEVCRYDEATLAAIFAPHFRTVACRRSVQTTAGEDQRPYVVCLLEKKDATHVRSAS